MLIDSTKIDYFKLKRVGIVGVPPRSIINDLQRHQVRIYDLDEPLTPVSLETVGLLPQVYCAILRTVVVNALHLDLDAIFIDIGPGKCDNAHYTARILSHRLPIPVIICHNLDAVKMGNPICRSSLPLLEKFRRITASVIKPDPAPDPPIACPPKAGFWGVPPRDFKLLEFFPDRTHVYGWTRCMENKTPADHVLESYCNSTIPTVFFAQSFCPKTALARFLATCHPQALYLDVDSHCSGSAQAKIQAFLELSGVQT
ncbi:MAG: hypothetical protein EYX74_04065 [Desulfobulbaceae bacterium]|nr:MAG: hypothetical protein EYX74_04065 [Desulfobulbaceae bacterium]